MLDRRSLLARGLGALVAVSGLNRLEKLVPPAVAAPGAEAPTFAAGALAANGGLCAPIVPYYFSLTDLQARPIRDAFPLFKAEHGPRHTYFCEDEAGV